MIKGQEENIVMVASVGHLEMNHKDGEDKPCSRSTWEPSLGWFTGILVVFNI